MMNVSVSRVQNYITHKSLNINFKKIIALATSSISVQDNDTTLNITGKRLTTNILISLISVLQVHSYFLFIRAA